MHHAIQRFGIALLLLGLLIPAGRARAAAVQRIDGTGLIDYSRTPDFRVGTWAKYHVTGSSEAGAEDDYEVTVLIAGQEKFWGDDCFWVETWQRFKNRAPITQATLVSYSIFDDPSPMPDVQLYLRKFIEDLTPDGKPVERVPRPTREFAKRRTQSPNSGGWVADTLGSDSVRVPMGRFWCRKVSLKNSAAATIDHGDSSVRRFVRDDRVRYVSHKVPLTSLVREDIMNEVREKLWRLGHSKDARDRLLDRSTGSAVLVGYGTGLTPQLVPEALRTGEPNEEKRAPAGTRSGRSGRHGRPSG